MAQSQPVEQTPQNGVAPNEDEIDHANYKNKITISQIGGNPTRAKSEKKRVAVCQIYGIATGLKAVDAPNGDTFIAILGNFEAVNMETGDVYRSGTMYLPSGFHEVIQSQLESLAENREGRSDKPQVEFALAIDAEPANNPSGYSYVARSLVPPAKADPLSALRAQAHKALPPPVRQLTDQTQAA